MTTPTKMAKRGVVSGVATRKRRAARHNTTVTMSTRRRCATSWDDLPPEMCRALVAEMDMATRMRVAQCSQSCDEFARYLYQIAVTDNGDHFLMTMGWEVDEPCTVWIEFHPHENDPQQTFILYRCLKDSRKMVVKWKIDEPGESKDVCLKYFNRYTNHNKDTIQHVYIAVDDDYFNDFQLDLTKFKKMDSFHLELGTDTLVPGTFLDFKKMKRLQTLKIPDAVLKMEEIQKFPGELIQVSTKDVVNDQIVVDFLRNLKSSKKLKEVELSFENDQILDIPKICETLQGFDCEQTEGFDSWQFNFSSNSRQNGSFLAVFRRSKIEIIWKI